LKDDKRSCVISEVSRILQEEPRLEAVALSEDRQRLSIATLGPDDNNRLADRVSQAVAEGMADCGHLSEAGVCSACGEKPSTQVRGSRVVVKEVLGNTLIEKQTCPTAISFWKWSL
jgi:hypothetical protein